MVRYPEVSIVSVDNGLEGMGMIEQEWPELVMAASPLTDTDNLYLIKKIRELSDVPLIILSEAKTNTNIARGLEAGADGYVTKPVSPIELLTKVRELVNRSQRPGSKWELAA